MADAPKTEEAVVVDNSVPYPEAPEVDHNNPRQQCYRGAKNPAQATRRLEQPPHRRGFGRDE